MLIDFESMLGNEFGDDQAWIAGLPYALQFSKTMVPMQQRAMRGAAKQHLQSVRKFVSEFRSALSHEVQSNESYSFQVFLIPNVGLHAKSSDLASEFLRYYPNCP